MRAADLPSPRALRNRLSPLPTTLVALAGLLALELASLPPTWLGEATATGEPSPFADVAPTAAAEPSPFAEVGPGIPPASTADEAAPPLPPPAEAEAEAGPPASVAPPRLVAGSSDTTDLIDALLAPGAGGEALMPAPAAPREDPLAAEPFLEERRALARQQEALGVRQLAVQVAEERLAALVDELTALKAEIDRRLEELEASDAARLARLVKLYEKMRPKNAARIFDELDFEVLVPLALEMNERKLAPIVAAMQPETARELTAEVAEKRGDASLATALEPAAP